MAEQARCRPVSSNVSVSNAPAPAPDLDDYLCRFYERAAIGEYDGGLDRVDAERQALGDVLTTFEAYGISR